MFENKPDGSEPEMTKEEKDEQRRLEAVINLGLPPDTTLEEIDKLEPKGPKGAAAA